MNGPVDNTPMNMRIEKLVYGGDGLARQDGATIFIPFVLPGEEAEVRITERRKKFWRGEAVNLLTRSADRVDPQCPYFTDCGGCQYQHASYEAQLRYKKEILRETLRRVGRVEWEGPVTAHGSPPYHYRNRAQWKIRPAGAEADIGYMRAASDSLCAVSQCPIVSPLLERTLGALRELLHDDPRFHALREVECFADHADERLTLTAEFTGWPRGAAQLAGVLQERIAGLQSVLFGNARRQKEMVWGDGFLAYEAAGHEYRVSHGSFFQVNRFLIDRLSERVVEVVGEGAAVLDLFAGVGLFSVPLAKKFRRVFAVESNLAAARDLDVNAQAAGGGIEAWHANVAEFLRKSRTTPDVIVLDPPRAGLSPDALHRICKLHPARVVYVSCEPSTLARDLAAFREKGYSLAGLDLFDLFPQTFHMESLAVLEPRG
jgi:23S rRNA (uracil1939-C5)-methyltransferase